MKGMNFNMFGIAHSSGSLLLGVTSIVGHVLVGLFVIIARKTVFVGRLGAVHVGRWFKVQTPIYIRKSLASINPHAKVAGKILRALIVVAIRNLETKSRPLIPAAKQLMVRQCAPIILRSRNKTKGKITESAKNDEAFYGKQDIKYGKDRVISEEQSLQGRVLGECHEDE